jgi:hypothetical protein
VLLDFVLRAGVPDHDVLPFLEATASLASLADATTPTPAPRSWLTIAKEVATMLGYGFTERPAGLVRAGEPADGPGPIAAAPEDAPYRELANVFEADLQRYLEAEFPGGVVTRDHESVADGYDLEVLVFTVRTAPDQPASRLAISFMALMKGPPIVEQICQAKVVDRLREEPGHRWLFDSAGRLTQQPG